MATNLDQARERLGFAARTVASGQAAVAAGDRNQAALASSAAEEAVASADLLLDGLTRADRDLAEASTGLDGALAEVRTDLAEADALATGDPGADTLRGPAAAARQAADQVEAARRAGPVDPIALMQQLAGAGAALDEALSGFRERRARAERAAALLTQALGAARSRVTAVQDFITTRRGAVGPEARTALAEATRLLDEATALADADPEQALRLAQQAQSAADDAARAAEHDVDDYGQSPWGGRGGGGNLGGIVLGGILLDTVLRGPAAAGTGVAGSAVVRGGGGFGGGGLSPGSFGGSGGRRGGGGRF